MEAIEKMEGELTPEDELAIEELETAIARKADSLQWVTEKLKAEAEIYKAQAITMKRFQKTVEASGQRIKERAVLALQLTEGHAIEGESYRVSLRKNPPKLIIDSEPDLPIEFFNEKTIWSLDNERLKKALLNNETIEGAHIERGVSLSFGRPKK